MPVIVSGDCDDGVEMPELILIPEVTQHQTYEPEHHLLTDEFL